MRIVFKGWRIYHEKGKNRRQSSEVVNSFVNDEARTVYPKQHEAHLLREALKYHRRMTPVFDRVA